MILLDLRRRGGRSGLSDTSLQGPHNSQRHNALWPQLPTPNSTTPNKLPNATELPRGWVFGSWELGVNWALGVGSWELGVDKLNSQRPTPQRPMNSQTGKNS